MNKKKGSEREGDWFDLESRGWREKTDALAVAVHVTTKSLRFAELEGTEPTLVDLTTLFFSLLPAAFLFPAPCSDRTQ